MQIALLLVPATAGAALLATAAAALCGHSLWSSRSVAVGIGASWLATAWLVGTLGGMDGKVTVEVTRWLSTVPVTAVELRCDWSTAAFLVPVATCALVIACQARRRDLGGARFCTALLYFAALGVYCANNFLQLVFFWELSALAAWLLAGTGRPESAGGAGRLLMLGQMTDLFLIMGVLLIWVSFRDLGFDVVFDAEAIAEVHQRNPWMIGTIGTCMLLTVLGRCAQFPFFGWLYDAADFRPETTAWLFCLLPPTGLYLLVRVGPFYAAASDQGLLAACLGALGAVMAAGCALTQADLQRVIVFVAGAQLGLALLGLGALAGRIPPAVVLVLVAGPLPAVTLLLLAANEIAGACQGHTDLALIGRHGERVAAGAFLVAALSLCGLAPLPGFFTQVTVLSAVGIDPTAAPLLKWALAAALLAQLLWSVSLARVYFLAFARNAEPAPRRGLSIVAGLLVVWGLVQGGLLLMPQPQFAMPAAESFVTLSTTLVALLGLLSGWMLFSRRELRAAAIARWLSALTRLSRHRFYVDEIGLLFVSLPIRAIAQLCRFADWFVVDAAVSGATGRIAPWLAGFGKPLQNGSLQFAALTGMLAGIVLLLVFLRILS